MLIVRNWSAAECTLNTLMPNAPQVVAVIVVHDPGTWFQESLDSLRDSDYPNLSCVFVDTSTGVRASDAILATLPEATIIEQPAEIGFGTACNIGARHAPPATHLLFCHDDVSFAPDAIRKMVEEAFLMNAGVVTPKYMVWNSPSQIVALGASMDRTGTVATRIDVGDLDQGQYDVSQEVFVALGGATLIRRDLFDAIKGFDEKMFLYYEDADLSWRAQIAGARIVAAPLAKVRHLAVSTQGARRARGGRRKKTVPVRARLPRHDRLRFARTNQLRALMSNTDGGSRLVSVVQYFFLSVFEVIFFLLTGKPKIAFSIVESWLMVVSSRASIRRKRKSVQQYKVKSDVELRKQMVRGSARVKGYINSRKNYRSQGEEARRVSAWRDYSSEMSLIDRLTKPGLRQARDAGRFDESTSSTIAIARVSRAFMWLIVALVVLGTRRMLFGTVPLYGQFLPFGPAHTLMATYFSGSIHHSGAIAPSPTIDLILGSLGYLFLGGTGVEAHFVIAALIALGLSGVFRIVADYRNRAAAYVSVALYAIGPILGGLISAASLGGLVIYGLAPWFLIRLFRLSNLPGTFRSTQLSTRYEVTVEAIWLGLIIAFAPSFIFIFVLLVLLIGIIGKSLGYLGHGKKYVVTQTGAFVIAVMLNLPWFVSFFVPGARLSALVGSAAPAHVSVLWLLLMRVSPAVKVAPLFGVYLVALAAALFFARERRADRVLTLVAIFSVLEVLAIFSSYGGLGQDPIPLAVILPVAFTVAVVAIGSGIEAAFSTLPKMGIGWRHSIIVLATLSILVSSYAMLGWNASGRYQLSSQGYQHSLGWMVPDSQSNPGNVLWLGRLGTLPVGSYRISSDMTAGVAPLGNPTVESLIPAANPGRDKLALQSISQAVQEDTVYLGKELAGLGIKYVVIPQSSLSNPSFLTSDLNLMLSRQRDLNQLVADPSVVAFSVQDPLKSPDVAHLTFRQSIFNFLRVLTEAAVALLWIGLIEATASRRSLALWLTRKFFATRFGQVVAVIMRLFKWTITSDGSSAVNRARQTKVKEIKNLAGLGSGADGNIAAGNGGVEFKHVKITSAAPGTDATEAVDTQVMDGED